MAYSVARVIIKASPFTVILDKICNKIVVLPDDVNHLSKPLIPSLLLKTCLKIIFDLLLQQVDRFFRVGTLYSRLKFTKGSPLYYD